MTPAARLLYTTVRLVSGRGDYQRTLRQQLLDLANDAERPEEHNGLPKRIYLRWVEVAASQAIPSQEWHAVCKALRLAKHSIEAEPQRVRVRYFSKPSTDKKCHADKKRQPEVTKIVSPRVKAYQR
jgi:hypothetical protein